MRFFLPFLSAWLVCATCLAEAPNTRDTPEEKAIKGALQYCLMPLTDHLDVASRASDLPQVDPAQRHNWPHDPTHIFLIDPGNSVLLTYPIALCSVASRRIEPATYWALVEEWFGSGTPFRLISRSQPSGAQERVYLGQLGLVTVQVMISTHDIPQEGGVQAVMTMALIELDKTSSDH